jgi:hypothetical protein
MATRSYALALPALPTDDVGPPLPPAPAIARPEPQVFRRRQPARGRGEFYAGALGGFVCVLLPIVLRAMTA